MFQITYDIISFPLGEIAVQKTSTNSYFVDQFDRHQAGKTNTAFLKMNNWIHVPVFNPYKLEEQRSEHPPPCQGLHS